MQTNRSIEEYLLGAIILLIILIIVVLKTKISSRRKSLYRLSINEKNRRNGSTGINGRLSIMDEEYQESLIITKDTNKKILFLDRVNGAIIPVSLVVIIALGWLLL